MVRPLSHLCGVGDAGPTTTAVDQRIAMEAQGAYCSNESAVGITTASAQSLRHTPIKSKDNRRATLPMVTTDA